MVRRVRNYKNRNHGDSAPTAAYPLRHKMEYAYPARLQPWFKRAFPKFSIARATDSEIHTTARELGKARPSMLR